jgi:hypothetical protein
MKEQHAAVVRVKATVEDENAALKLKLAELAASHATVKEANAALKAENAALKAQAASTLTEILTAVAAVTAGAMEILPVRLSDSRQFAEWRVGGIPPPPPPPAAELTPASALPLGPQFDRAWCAAVCANGWMVEIDVAGGDMRAEVTRDVPGYCTLRSAAPLPGLGPSPRFGPGGQRHPTYRIIVERWGVSGGEGCLGFVPSHHMYMYGGGAATAVAPTPEYGIHNYGGWYIQVCASRAGEVNSDAKYSGWTVTPPLASGWSVFSRAHSAYATTAEVPPVPEGGAVEFAVDDAAGTCRVAFYTPVAVAGGFVEAPHAKMELRFVATAANKDWFGRPVPARTAPTAAGSRLTLYPAVQVFNNSRIVWRFAAV